MSTWFRDHKISLCIGALVLVALIPLVTAKPQTATVSPKLLYTPACAALGSGTPTATVSCSSNPAGAVAIPVNATSLIVDTGAVTTNSQIFIEYDEMVSISGVTCNTSMSARGARYLLTGRTNLTSFTIFTTSSPSGSPVCLSYFIVN